MAREPHDLSQVSGTAVIAAATALFTSYGLGIGLWVQMLWTVPPVGLSSPNGWVGVYGFGMAVAMFTLVLFVGPRLPWRMSGSVLAAVALAFLPGGALWLNSAVDRSTTEYPVEVTGFRVERPIRGSPAWYLVAEDESGWSWKVPVGEQWTVQLPAGSRGSLRVHHGLLGMRWVSLHDVLPPG